MIKVYCMLGKHPIYETIVKYPPRGISFINAPSLNEYEKLTVYSPNYMKVKNLVLGFLNKFKIPRMFYLITLKKIDLIHSSRGILILNKMPWVVDIEHVGSFGAFRFERVKKISLKILSSNFCKKILPHSYASMYSFFNAWTPSKAIREKTEVLYPAIYPRKVKRKKSNTIRIGFMASRSAFYEKGGRELIEAFKILAKRYDNIQLWIKSKIPEEIKKAADDPKIKIIEKHYPSREELFENFYEKIDIFVLPTYVDSFGYSLLEAMSTRVPVISTNIFAIPEIIEDGRNGFLINSPLSDFTSDFIPKFFDRDALRKTTIRDVVKQLVEKLTILIENSSLREKMGRYGRKLVESGKFSIKVRNKKLKEIYEEAVS